MGNVCMSAEAREQEKQDERIQAQLDADLKIKKKTVKLLLLGAGESGKSTLVKQMKIIHGDGYSQTELKSYKPTICDNLVSSMRAVLEAMGILKIDLGDASNRIHVRAILTFSSTQLANGELSEEVAAAVRGLWADKGVQSCYARRNEFQLNDSAQYYFENIDRIASRSYTPNQQDVLRARVMTTGIIETSFEYRSKIYKVFDVGGQRSERKKWIECFDDVTAVIFVTALSGYDMKCYEDNDQNRVHESMQLFGEICNNRFFTRSAMILFMNKTDLFEQKIPMFPLKNTFPAFLGPEKDVQAAQQFLLQQFLSLNRNASKQTYHHFTCATDTSNITHVFRSVSDHVAAGVLDGIGLE